MKEKAFKKRKGDYIYHFYHFTRTVVIFNRFNNHLTFFGYGCALSRCLFPLNTCKFCPYCQK